MSKKFGFAAGNTTEALLALSVIVLPFHSDQLTPTMEIIGANGSSKLKSSVRTMQRMTVLLVRSLEVTAFESLSLTVSTYFDLQDRFDLVSRVRIHSPSVMWTYICSSTNIAFISSGSKRRGTRAGRAVVAPWRGGRRPAAAGRYYTILWW